MYKVELKVHMCCTKCEEIVSEEIRYLGGKCRFSHLTGITSFSPIRHQIRVMHKKLKSVTELTFGVGGWQLE